MRAQDWSASSLGNPRAWPQPLQTLTSLMLHSPAPAFIAWGTDLCVLYNDAYLGILDRKHPAALGRPFASVWAEVWTDIEPLVRRALAGESVQVENLSLVISRNGQKAPAWFSFSYVPIHDQEGAVAGLYCTATETTGRVLAEETRQAQTARLHTLFEQAPSFMALVREPGHVYEMANSAYFRLTGRQDLIGKTFGETFHKVDGPDYGQLLDQVQATGQPFIGNRMPVMFSRHKGGPAEQHFVNFIFQPVTGPDGAINGIFIEGSDVTHETRTEDELRASKRHALEIAQQLDALLQAAPVGIVLVDTRGKLLRANLAARQLWGNHPQPESVDGYDQCKGWWVDDSARHGRQLQSQDWAMARALRGEEAPRDTVEIEPFGKPGVRRTILSCGAPVRGPDGEIIGSVVAQMDITERIRVEAALRKTVNQYHALANAIPQIIWATQPDGYHDYYNQQWYDYTGVPHDSADGEGWEALFHSEDQPEARKRWAHSLATGDAYEIEYRLRHHSGEYRWVLGRALPVHDEQGAITRWMGTCTDIDEQKLAQAQLQQSDRLKNEFLAMLAHELRNPLAPIATAADLLFTGKLGDDQVQRLSEVITRQIRHMTHLIDDLLDVSRVTRGQVTLNQKTVDMKNVITEALEQVKPLMEAKAHYLELLLAPEPCLVSGDRMRLVQVLANVLNNAIKYTPNGGCIALRTVVKDQQLTLCVRDNGIGMSSELLGMAFELFTQGERASDRSQGGLGIGLALVRSLVHLHGGTASVHSHGVGLGSELTITLPLLQPDDAHGGPDDEVTGTATGGESLRVLVVDDNIDAARLLGMFVEMLGHKVYVQFHPADALECARQVRPQVCLLDIGLPDMDGYTLARQLRQLPGMADTMLAAVTGYSQRKDKQAAFDAGFNAHFAKPVNAQQLKTWLAEVVAQRTGHKAVAGAAG